ESRQWNGNNSDGISILQLIHFEDQDQLEDKLALNGADADYYNFNDISTPTNSQFWDNRDSNTGIWAVSEAGQRMEAYFDVPGPGILVYPKELHENAIVKVTTHYSLDLINTDDIGSPGSGVRVSLQGLDPTLFDYDLPDRDYLIFPKEPFNYTFSVTPKMTCADFVQSGETSYYFNLLVQAEGLHWLESKEIPVKLDLIPGPIELSVTPTARIIQPDFSASFQAQFANLGWEQKNIALMLNPVPLDDDYLAYPDQIQPEWITHALSGFLLGSWNTILKPCGENSITRNFSLKIPGDSYAAIEDAVYEFDVVATPHPYTIENPDSVSIRCQITIRATAQSMLNYVKYYGGRLLQKDFTTMSVSLQAKAKSIIEKSELAILKHEKGLLGVTENMLNAVKNKTDAFINEVEAQTGKSLSFDEATLLINEAEQIKLFVDTTIEALPFSFDIGDITIKRNLKN
ncbi:MAG: hypothetical protein KAR01_00615, partial [Desulfocapsa sp.]|nr:hypothetical protein [Desulfocapsa sp.]